ncbi:MAG TPA: exodeoxyribonuclease VII small subunit, partial [bacterium]|nr:exodeoxyribonuclease VII small subunit [bacterium]
MAEAPKFEEGLAALEKLVSELEQGDLGLDEALKRFEKGVKVAAQLQAALEQSQRKVEQLASGK